MRTAAIVVSAVALLIFVVIAFNERSLGSYAAALAALAALIGSYFLGRDTPPPSQKQDVGAGGFGIQAGRDVKGRDFKNEK